MQDIQGTTRDLKLELRMVRPTTVEMFHFGTISSTNLQ
jgi:hypothetical protein